MRKQGYAFDDYTAVNGGHGRIETRRSLSMVESIRGVNGKSSHEKRHYISSLDGGAQEFGDAVRQHCGIEGSVHWNR